METLGINLGDIEEKYNTLYSLEKLIEWKQLKLLPCRRIGHWLLSTR